MCDKHNNIIVEDWTNQSEIPINTDQDNFKLYNSETEYEKEPENEENEITNDDEENEEKLYLLQEEYEKLNARYERLQTDWTNYKRRTEENRTNEKVEANAKLIVTLLPILDDLELAILHSKDKAGHLAIYKKLISILQKEGITQIDPKGEPFNLELHQAIERIPTIINDEDNTIRKVFQKGYILNNRVLRPAMVSVYVS